jgi:hypothetical protein
MYLVELRPGKEELYRTGDDLAAAIRRGDVDVHSRIYHRATSKWISITLHPQYKAIASTKPPTPGPTQGRGSWTYLNAQSESLEVRETEAEGDGHQVDPEAGGAPPVERSSRPWRRLFALSVSGLALLFGTQLAFSGPRPPWSGSRAAIPGIPAVDQEEEPGRNEQVVSLASTGDWSEENALEETPTEPEKPVKAPAHALPRAPAIRMKTLNEVLPAAAAKPASAAKSAAAPEMTVESLIQRYTAAQDSALSRLASGIRVARLNQMLAASRLTPDGGVTETRLGLAGVANFIRVYRQQKELIEGEYQDSFSALARERRWSTKALQQWHTRQVPRESQALVTLSSRLLSNVDSVLALLTEQAGAYRLGENTIAFEDINASRRYARLRRHVSSLIDSTRIAGGEESVGPTNYLLQAIGTTRLPREI